MNDQVITVLEAKASSLAEKANECCYRSDGYEEEMQQEILLALRAAYELGYSTKEQEQLTQESKR